MIRKFLLLLTIIVPLGAIAEFNAEQALFSAPEKLIGYIGKTERLDMADYLRAGLTDRTVRNRRGGNARMVSLEPMRAEFMAGTGQTFVLALLPTAKNDTMIALIETLETPTPDSSMSLFDRNWNPAPKAWRAPADKEWGKPKAPFLLTEYTLSGDTLTLEDRTAEWAETGAAVSRLKYVWNPKAAKFSKLK